MKSIFIVIISFFSFVANLILGKKSVVDIVTSVKLDSPEHQAIALSFDDGPDWGEESLIVALDGMGMKGTFFWTWQKIHLLREQNADKFTKLVRLIKEGGHEIGIHGINCDTPSNLSEKLRDVVGELNDPYLVRKNFSELLKQDVRLYRPHNFQSSSGMVEALKTSGLKLVIGSPRYQIGQNDPYALLFKAFKRSKPGSIICCHDSMDCEPDFKLAEEIAQVIPQLARISTKRKLKVLTISEILSFGI